MLALLAPVNLIDQLLLKLGLGQDAINYVVWPLLQIGIVVTVVAVWVAYGTYLERKISAFMQARLGPMRVGPWGLLQPIADGLKLLTKEDFIPEKADRWIFFFAPYIAVAAAFIVFSVMPFGPDWAVITDVNIGLLFVIGVSSVGVLALILAVMGWIEFGGPAILDNDGYYHIRWAAMLRENWPHLPAFKALPLTSQFRQALRNEVLSFALQLSPLCGARQLLCGARQLCQPASAAFADAMLLHRDCHRGPLARRF